MQNKLQFSLITLLAIIAISTIWLISTSGKIKLPLNKPQNPDSFINNVEAIQFNEQGKAHHSLKSPKLINYLKDNTTNIEKPFYTFQNEQDAAWNIQADFGAALHGMETITLTGHVTIQQLPGKNSRNVTLLTDKMIFYPSKSFAETDRPVTIKQPGIIIKGIGLQADLKTGKIKLLSKTKAEYKKD